MGPPSCMWCGASDGVCASASSSHTDTFPVRGAACVDGRLLGCLADGRPGSVLAFPSMVSADVFHTAPSPSTAASPSASSGGPFSFSWSTTTSLVFSLACGRVRRVRRGMAAGASPRAEAYALLLLLLSFRIDRGRKKKGQHPYGAAPRGSCRRCEDTTSAIRAWIGFQMAERSGCGAHRA